LILIYAKHLPIILMGCGAVVVDALFAVAMFSGGGVFVCGD
jgi:hypothetical protein